MTNCTTLMPDNIKNNGYGENFNFKWTKNISEFTQEICKKTQHKVKWTPVPIWTEQFYNDLQMILLYLLYYYVNWKTVFTSVTCVC